MRHAIKFLMEQACFVCLFDQAEKIVVELSIVVYFYPAVFVFALYVGGNAVGNLVDEDVVCML